MIEYLVLFGAAAILLWLFNSQEDKAKEQREKDQKFYQGLKRDQEIHDTIVRSQVNEAN